MRPDEDSVHRSLQALLGRDVVREPTEADAHRTPGPLVWASPRTEDQLRELLAWARQERIPVYPRGGGTRWGSAFPPFREGVGVDLRDLGRVVDLDAGNLSVVAEAGVTHASLQEALSPHRLFFPPDLEHPEVSTLGGEISTDAAGPRRYAYGSVRPYLLGCRARFPNDLGGLFGGSQTKNVSGYNLSRFLCGSWGLLGVVTQVIVKVRPCPERRSVRIVVGRPRELLELAHEVRLALQGVVAIEALFGPPAGAFTRGLAPPGVLLIGLEGMEEEVSWSAGRLEEMAGRHGLGVDEPPLGAEDVWRVHRLVLSSDPLYGDSCGVRTWTATVVPSELGTVVTRIAEGEFGPVGVSASVGNGVARIMVGSECAARPLLEETSRTVRASGGRLFAHSAEDALRTLEVLPTPGPLREVWRRLKDLLDPAHVMCPAGRFGG